MKKASIMLILLVVLLAACGVPKSGVRKPTRRMSVSDMFPDDRQAQLLAAAAAKGDVDRIDELVAKGANVNAVGEYGVTVPYWVLLHPNKQGFRRLLEHGADPNIIWVDPKDGSENSLLHEAVIEAPYIGSEYLKMALEIGKGDPNLACGTFNEPPLRWGLDRGDEEVFILLYNAGADIECKTCTGKDLITYAVGAWNYEMVYFMLINGVDYGFRLMPVEGFDVSTELTIVLSINGTFTHGKELTTDSDNPQYMWFWRCVDFLEKRGLSFDIPADVKRPAKLGTSLPDFVSKLRKR